jgi:hypothetical protein
MPLWSSASSEPGKEDKAPVTEKEDKEDKEDVKEKVGGELLWRP